MKRISEVLFTICIAAVAFAADLDRGKELFHSGKHAEAAAELRQVVNEHGDNATAQRYLGLALLEQNKASEAEPHLKKADELESTGETKLALAKLYVAQKNWDQAEAAVGGASGDGLEYVRGLVRFNKQQYEDAAKDFEAALEKQPDNAYAHYYAGLAYNSLKRPDRMLTHFEHFVKMKPDAPEARKVRAVLKTGR